MNVAPRPGLCLCLTCLGLASAEGKESAGDLSSVVSAVGDSFAWPERFAALKDRLRPPRRQAALLESWERLERALDLELAEIRRLQGRAIPIVNFSELEQNNFSWPEELKAEVKKRGVVIVRGVAPTALARSWKQRVQDYARRNPGFVGFPRDDPQVLELYWSKPQLEARQHPSMHATMLALNSLWSGGSHVGFDRAFTYGERLRIRRPGDGRFVLQPHSDGGSIERFEDPHYRKAYREVLAGRWEAYDPWEGDERAQANMSMYLPPMANGYCTVFRAFQGWMALSNIGAGPGAGTLRVLPLLREATARVLLRPFLPDVPPGDFCGAVPGMAHDISEKWHARLLEAMVPLPAMQPGDTVWWHADIIHAVEAEHRGEEDSSVFYIPSLPATEQNLRYVRQQRQHFEEGRTPPDFPPNDSEVDFEDRGTEEDLTPLGRQMLGFQPRVAGLEGTNVQAADLDASVQAPFCSARIDAILSSGL